MIKEVKRTAQPSIETLTLMARNLKIKFHASVCVSIDNWNYSHRPDDKGESIFAISLVFAHDDVKRYEHRDWNSLLGEYFKLMESSDD